MANGAAAGKTFLAGVLDKLPESVRGEAAKLFETPELQAAVGDGTLAQAELSRQLDALKTKERELAEQRDLIAERDAEIQRVAQAQTDWYGKNSAALEEWKVMKAKGTQPDPSKTPPAGLTQEAFDKRIAEESAGVLGFTTAVNRLQREHFGRFGEILDIEPLVRHPQVREQGLEGVYSLVHKDRLDAHAKKVQTEAEEKIRADERAKIAATQASMPYLTPTGAGSGSPLDALQATQVPDSLVDKATQEYQRLVQARANGATV